MISLDSTPLHVLDAMINGELFLEVLEDEVLDDLEISWDFKILIERKVSQVRRWLVNLIASYVHVHVNMQLTGELNCPCPIYANLIVL